MIYENSDCTLSILYPLEKINTPTDEPVCSDHLFNKINNRRSWIETNPLTVFISVAHSISSNTINYTIYSITI